MQCLWTNQGYQCFLFSRGRVWVYHLSLSSGPPLDCPLLEWHSAVAFFPPLICIHKQTIKNWVGHCRNENQQWPSVELSCWTQTLSRPYRIHEYHSFAFVFTQCELTLNLTQYAEREDRSKCVRSYKFLYQCTFTMHRPRVHSISHS